MSGDDGLREAVVVWLADTYESAYQHATIEPDFDWDVDALLALPEVAALRARADAADRVRDEIDALSRETGAFEASYKGWALKVVSAVGRALDGSSPC